MKLYITDKRFDGNGYSYLYKDMIPGYIGDFEVTLIATTDLVFRNISLEGYYLDPIGYCISKDEKYFWVWEKDDRNTSNGHDFIVAKVTENQMQYFKTLLDTESYDYHYDYLRSYKIDEIKDFIDTAHNRDALQIIKNKLNSGILNFVYEEIYYDLISYGTRGTQLIRNRINRNQKLASFAKNCDIKNFKKIINKNNTDLFWTNFEDYEGIYLNSIQYLVTASYYRHSEEDKIKSDKALKILQFLIEKNKLNLDDIKKDHFCLEYLSEELINLFTNKNTKDSIEK